MQLFPFLVLMALFWCCFTPEKMQDKILFGPALSLLFHENVKIPAFFLAILAFARRNGHLHPKTGKA